MSYKKQSKITKYNYKNLLNSLLEHTLLVVFGGTLNLFIYDKKVKKMTVNFFRFRS